MSAETVGPGELAEALGVTERHVYRLHRLGMPKEGRGEYPLVRCARWYRTQVLSPNGDGEVPDLGEARLRKAKAAALEAERELARRREELVPSEVWDHVTAETEGWLRREVVSLTPELADALEGVDGAGEAAAALQAEVRTALERLRQGPDSVDTNEEEGRERRVA